MREHQSAVHENIRKFVCDFPGCSQTFVKPSRLKYHYERVHSDKKIICDKCGLVCSSKNEVRYHLWSHLKLKGKQKRYECKICFKKYYLKSSYKRHKLNVHKKSDESLVENLERYEHFIPEVKIEIKQEMEDFENLPIKEEEDEFQDYCSDVEATDSIKNPSGAEFDQIFLRDPEKSKSDDSEIREKPEIVKQKAKFHRKSTGRKTENPKKFCCEHCTKIYSTWRGLKLHTRQYHGIELPPRVVEPDRKIIKLTSPPICDYCGDQLKTKATLIIHFRKHVKNLAPEFCCQFCGKVFNHFSSFQLHRKGHTKEYTKQCPHCTQKFLTNQTLKWHVDYHHMNKPAIPKEICQVCGKAVQKFYMKIHLKTHSSEFKCSVCGRSCITEESLKSHYMQHTKNRPFSCVYCDKSYTFQKNLKFHIRKFHSDIPGIEDFIASFNKRNFL
jgi:KRAB domain-containing zinc finger protein